MTTFAQFSISNVFDLGLQITIIFVIEYSTDDFVN